MPNHNVWSKDVYLNKVVSKLCSAVSWICIGLSTDPDPAFYLSADPDLGSQTNADLDPGQTLPSLTVEFYMKNILYVG